MRIYIHNNHAMPYSNWILVVYVQIKVNLSILHNTIINVIKNMSVMFNVH